MKVIEYLKEHGLERLKEEFAIRVKEYPEEGLLVLNYDQINSRPKDHPIVRECRGLILDSDFNMVSKSFNRFFNLGEIPEEDEKFDISRAVCFEKVDGSLIKIYNYCGTWYCSTRGTAFAEAQTPMGVSFKELVYRALEVNSDLQFNELCDEYLEREFTYIFEITSSENRVVKVYEGTTLWYLGCNNSNNTKSLQLLSGSPKLPPQVRLPKAYSFGSFEEIRLAADNLKDLDEGYVCLDTSTGARLKIKSPTYLAVHSLRGEGLSTKRILELVCMNEQEEYLAYYPEDRKYFDPYEESLKALIEEMETAWEHLAGISDQKQFALLVKDKLYSAVMFKARQKGVRPTQSFYEQEFRWQCKALEAYHNG